MYYGTEKVHLNDCLKQQRMDKKLHVIEFNKKRKLVDFVNENAEKLTIQSITSSCEGISNYRFLWYYKN